MLYQCAIAQLVLPPLIIMGWRVRLWYQDPLGVCVTMTRDLSSLLKMKQVLKKDIGIMHLIKWKKKKKKRVTVGDKYGTSGEG